MGRFAKSTSPEAIFQVKPAGSPPGAIVMYVPGACAGVSNPPLTRRLAEAAGAKWNPAMPITADESKQRRDRDFMSVAPRRRRGRAISVRTLVIPLETP